MRVAFVSMDFGEYSVRIASALAEHIDVLLVMPEKIVRHYLDLLSPRVQYHPLPSPRLRQPVRQLKMMRGAIQAVREFAPDLIHMQHHHLWMNLTLVLLRDIPLVTTIHDAVHHVGDKNSQKTPRLIADISYRQASQLIAHSQYVTDLASKRLQIDRGRFHIVPHVLLGGGAPSTANDTKTSSSVLFFGRIWPYKGLEYLIEAEPLISERIPNVKFVIAGRGEDIGRYQAMMVHPERFLVLNRYITDEERAALFRESSLVALPYIEASQSGVIPVAFNYGKPVVATNVGGLPEAVTDGVTGLLVPPRDVSGLADAIVTLLNSPELRSQLGAAAQRQAQTEWSAEAIGRQTLDVYRAALR